MASSKKVINLTTGSQIKRSQAASWVEQGFAAWVEDGFTVRSLSLAERVAHRAKQQALEASLAPIELSDCVWEPPERDKFTQSERYALVGAAYQFHRESIFPAQ